MPEGDEMECECCGDRFRTGENPTKGSLLITAETCAAQGGQCTRNIDACILGGGVAAPSSDCLDICCVRSSTVILDLFQEVRVQHSQTFKDSLAINVLQLTQIRRVAGTWKKGGTGGRSKLCVYIDGNFRVCGTQCVAVGEIGVVDFADTMAGRVITLQAQDQGCGAQLPQNYLDQLDVLLTLASAEADVEITRRGATGTTTGKTDKSGTVQFSLLVPVATYDFVARLVVGGIALIARGSFVAPPVGTKITVSAKMALDPSGGGGGEPPPEEEESFLEKYGVLILGGAVVAGVAYAATRKKKRG